MEDDGEKSSFVIGVIENSAKEVGVAAFDLRSASLHLSQYIETGSSYQNTKTLLHFYHPLVIIVPSSELAPETMTGISTIADEYFSATKKVPVAPACFDDTKGAVLFNNLVAMEPSADHLDIDHVQYNLCLAAAAATIDWVQNDQEFIITNHSLSVTLNGSLDHVNIDATSVQNLELIKPLRLDLTGTSNIKRSLFHILRTTRTIGGTRLLRANLLQPLKDIETINERLDCLDELMSNKQLFCGLSEVLHKFPIDTDRVLYHFCYKPNKVTNEAFAVNSAKKRQTLVESIFILKKALDALPLLSQVLQDAKSSLLRSIYKSVCENKTYDLIRERIADVIDEDVAHARAPIDARTQQCFFVKAGIDALLDIAQRTICDTSEAINNLANKYREDYGLPNLGVQGIHFSIPQTDVQGNLPDKFIEATEQGNSIICSTMELSSLNARKRSAYADRRMRTQLCLEGCRLNDTIRKHVSVLKRLADILCLLDMIVNSFAHMISTRPADHYSRPEFTDSGTLAIDAGRHPILESIHNDLIPNSTFLSEASNMVIVTGPNMSGKSTYLQQVCLIVILAHIGCYVPARFSSIRVVDQIVIRMGAVDNLEPGSSMDMTEMQNISQRSLVVMDELGRATSTSDGFALGWSCCEHLSSLKAYTIFATHMESSQKLADMFTDAEVLHFNTDIINNRLDLKQIISDMESKWKTDINELQIRKSKLLSLQDKREEALKLQEEGLRRSVDVATKIPKFWSLYYAESEDVQNIRDLLSNLRSQINEFAQKKSKLIEAQTKREQLHAKRNELFELKRKENDRCIDVAEKIPKFWSLYYAESDDVQNIRDLLSNLRSQLNEFAQKKSQLIEAQTKREQLHTKRNELFELKRKENDRCIDVAEKIPKFWSLYYAESDDVQNIRDLLSNLRSQLNEFAQKNSQLIEAQTKREQLHTKRNELFELKRRENDRCIDVAEKIPKFWMIQRRVTEPVGLDHMHQLLFEMADQQIQHPEYLSDFWRQPEPEITKSLRNAAFP